MTDGRNVIGAGPGFVGYLNRPNEFSADVELEVVYGPEHDTVASLILRAINVEGGPAFGLAVGVELTAGDLAQIRDWCEAMRLASEEDRH